MRFFPSFTGRLTSNTTFRFPLCGSTGRGFVRMTTPVTMIWPGEDMFEVQEEGGDVERRMCYRVRQMKSS